MNSVLFLTGGTGFIGANLLCEVLTHQRGTRVIALVRAASREEAQRRLERALCSVAPSDMHDEFAKRVFTVCGDVALPHLGLSDHDYELVASQTTHIVHSAATVNFDSSLEQARRTNVGGTTHLLDLARAARRSGQLERVGYIGTAYVSGLKEGLIEESRLDNKAGFTNNYEQSKHEAEQVVRGAFDELPVIIFRPSIVVGHSTSGVTTTFNVLYPALRMIQDKKVVALPGFRGIPLDVVPVDYVARAISYLLFHVAGAVGQTYHLTAGEQHSCTAGDIVDTAVAFFNRRLEKTIPRVRFIPPVIYRALLFLLRDLRRHTARIISIYQPYLTVRRSFDTTNSSRDLRAAGICPPPLTAYLDILLQYCVSSNWGKHPYRVAA